MSSPFRCLLVVVLVSVNAGCAAVHRQHVANMKANGDPRASCYEACGPSGVMCMRECDNKQAARNDAQASGVIDQDTARRLLSAAAADDEARKKSKVASGGSATDAPPLASPAPRSSPPSTSGVSVSEKKSPLPPSPTECRPDCVAPKKCTVFLEGSRQCAPNSMCWTVDRTHAECR